MKKDGILNGPLSKIVASMGHTDMLVVCDSGLPIPKNAEVVDLALTVNIPRFIETLKIILQELSVERAVIAEEFLNNGNGTLEETKKLLPGVNLETVSHEKFKEITRTEANIAFVRTGEATPYANIILISGVTF